MPNPTDALPSVKISKCVNSEQIYRIIDQNYSDEPLRSFSNGVKRTFSKSWCLNKLEVCFLVAEIDGREAGFLIGHSLGPRIWRAFAKEHLQHLVSIFYVLLRQRVKRKFRTEPQTTTHSISEDDLKLTNTNRPFPWQTSWGNGAILEFIMVYPEHRGQSIAPKLIQQFTKEMNLVGASYCEAHISPYNSASARAFIKSGWAVYRTKFGDIWASSPDQSNEKSDNNG